MIMVIGSDHDDYSEGFDPEWNLAGKNSTNSKFGSVQIQIKNIFLLSSVMGKVDNKRGTSVMSNRWKTTSMKVSVMGNVQIHVNVNCPKFINLAHAKSGVNHAACALLEEHDVRVAMDTMLDEVCKISN